MDEKTQQEFIGWLASKLQVEDESQLQEAIDSLGEDGIANAFEMFQQEKQRETVVMASKGAKLRHLQNLQKYKEVR